MAGLDDAKAYMAKREIPQLFESMMTALMYQKPDDHIKFLGECLSKAEQHPKIQWHSFIEPLPPIASTSEKIHSENGNNSAMSETRKRSSPTRRKTDPLPPIMKSKDSEQGNTVNDDANIESGEKSDSKPSSPNQDFKLSSPITSIYMFSSIEDDVGLEEKNITPRELIDDSAPSDNLDNIISSAPETTKDAKLASEVELSSYKEEHTSSSGADIKPPVLFVLGGPGCGKGTQCAKVAEDYGYLHLSAGDLLRNEVAKENQSGKMIAEIIKQGQLVPQEITIGLLRDAMLAAPDAIGYLVDGFPREISQGEQFEREVKVCAGLIMFDCSDETLIERLQKRAATSDRTDDQMETIKKRLKLFHTTTMPVISQYSDKVIRIDANRSIDEVYEDLKAYMDNVTSKQKDLDQLAEAVVAVLATEGNLSGQETEQDMNAPSEVPETADGPTSKDPEKDDDSSSKVQKKEEISTSKDPEKNNGDISLEISEKEAMATSEEPKNEDSVPAEQPTKEESDPSVVSNQNDNVSSEEPEKASDKTGDDEPPKTAVVEEQFINPENEVPVGGRGYSRDFAKSVLAGKQIIFVIGGPGCGKGTQCAMIVEKYGHKHLSVGDILRSEVLSGSDVGSAISECMSKGELVPRHLVIRALLDSMIADEKVDKFIIDGYPRELVQGEEFEKEVAECTRVLYFHCPSDVMVERLTKRAETSGRSDDNEETIKKRLIVFEEEVKPILEYYKEKDKLAQIPATGTAEDIFGLVCTELDSLAISKSMDPKEVLKDANIVFVLGGPGSGKGTQCEKIIKKYGFCHLSTGDLLREEVQSGSKRADALKEIMGKGELVSQDTILELLSEAMIKRKDSKGFLIDGFPRDVPQGQKFENEVGTCKFILYFDCTNECMVERLLGRAKTSGRVDDNEVTIQKRLKTFEEQTLPVLGVYDKQGKIRKVNAERGVDDIFSDVCVALDALF